MSGTAERSTDRRDSFELTREFTLDRFQIFYQLRLCTYIHLLIGTTYVKKEQCQKGFMKSHQDANLVNEKKGQKIRSENIS